MSDFESLGLKAGSWSGLLHRATAPQRAGLVHNGELVAQARVTAVKEGTWRLDVDLPADRLSEGVTSFLLFEDIAGDGEGSGEGRGEPLASLSISAGLVLDRDLLAEVALIRAELDLLKREFRRLGSR